MRRWVETWLVRLTEWIGELIPETGWCISEWAISDFQWRDGWWTRKCDSRWGSGTASGLNRDQIVKRARLWRFYEAGSELPTAFCIDLVFLVEFSIYFWPCCVQWPISGFAKDRYWKAKISSLGMWSKLLVILEDCRRFFGVYKEKSFYWSSSFVTVGRLGAL